MSPTLIPKPDDWPDFIDVCGFAFLNTAGHFKPPDDLNDFLGAGPAPIYVGFGSIVVEDPRKLTRIVFEAIRRTGQRAVVSKGWGNLDIEESQVSPDIFMLQHCPHDWLFQHVSCVVHHGGAGTTAAGLLFGRPTVIVPFFGDQPFWGAVVSRAGAGPDPVPYKTLTAENLASAILQSLQPSILHTAGRIGRLQQTEDGVQGARASFHRHLRLDKLRCSICPDRPAVWWVQHAHIKLSAFAASVLAEEGLIDPRHVVRYRTQEYDTTRDPRGPFYAIAGVLYGLACCFVRGTGQIPEWINSFWLIISRKSMHRRSYGFRNTAFSTAGPWGMTPTQNSSGQAQFENRTQDPLSQSGAHPAGQGKKVSLTERFHNRQDEIEGGGHGLSGSQTVPLPESDLEHTFTRFKAKGEGTKAQRAFVEFRFYTGRLIKQFFLLIILLPTDITLGVSKGYHNSPNYYHDPTVEALPMVTGFRSGLQAAKKVSYLLLLHLCLRR